MTSKAKEKAIKHLDNNWTYPEKINHLLIEKCLDIALQQKNKENNKIIDKLEKDYKDKIKERTKEIFEDIEDKIQTIENDYIMISDIVTQSDIDELKKKWLK